MQAFLAEAGDGLVIVCSPQAGALRQALLGPDVTITSDEPGRLEVFGLTAEQIGARAARDQLTLHQLTSVTPSLENAYMELTADSVQYRAESASDRSNDPWTHPRTEQRSAA